MTKTLQKIRWRLLVGIASLGAAVALTLPAAASQVDLAQRAGQLVPNAINQVADIIWPNGAEYLDIIWPNAALLGDSISGDSGGWAGNN